MGRMIDALRRRFGGRPVAGALQVFDEVYVPTRFESLRELERQAEVPAPAPSPGDGDRDTYRGTIRLDPS